MIVIDGSEGEGGGQVLRTALSLSATTGQPFRIEKIRAKRKKPGLMRQHLTCVEAMAAVCGGEAEGAELGSATLTFTPGDIKAGDYAFAVGTAGSTGLVFQTVLPALLAADGPSQLTLNGGTHNPQAPSYEAIAESFLPALASADIVVETSLTTRGFYPAGGGEWHARVTPSDLSKPLNLCSRGALVSLSAEAMVSNLPGDIAKRELGVVKDRLGLAEGNLHIRSYASPGPGNALVIRAVFENTREIYVGFGEMGVTAERVADRLCDDVRRFLKSEAAVGHHLADQLLLPMALGAGGTFTTVRPSLHFETNSAVIEKFLNVDIDCVPAGEGHWRVKVSR